MLRSRPCGASSGAEITYEICSRRICVCRVNRQKTVFLASAAHELKTPLAVIKGYYDLLLTNSLGRLSRSSATSWKNQGKLQRLVRLVSMFLNYSALESGKLVLQMRENDLRDCLRKWPRAGPTHIQRKV
jgi:signal transduction histidine kinase